jgi:uncharacterized membrane protein
MDKNALEQLLSSYNWWMGVSTVAVALGILGEYVAHFVFEKEARRNRLEMGISILFGVLVLGGVVGEYVFGKKLSQVSEQLQQIADAEVAQSNKDAAQAHKDAEIVKQQSAETNARAAEAEQQASEENERAAKALRAAEIARKNAEGFQLQIAQANERAAKAELEVARIKSSRTLNPEQRQRVGTTLLKFSGQDFSFLVFTDAESFGLLADVNEALKIAKWNKVASPPGIGSGFTFTSAAGPVSSINAIGLTAYIASDDPASEPAMLALINALRSDGISCAATNTEDLKGRALRQIIIVVGQKQM